LFKKWQLAHQIITQFTPSTTRAQTRQYHSHRPATSAERIARHRLKKNCPHSYIVFGKCQNCQLILR
jgi:hypothetical protein